MAENSHDGRRASYTPRRARRGRSASASAGPGQRRRRRIAVWTVSAVAVVVIACVVVAGLYLNRLSTAFDDQRNVIDVEMEDDTAYRTSDDVINVLLMGTDSRGEDEDQYREETGEGDERSDTMMFVHIPADRSGIYVMSIMRDLWVDIPGEGEGRVNSAFGAGGEALVASTLEEMLETHIDHIAIIDFDGFSDLTEALGGVYVDNPRAFSAGLHNPAFYPEGTIRLAGSDALRFVRERQAFVDGDYTRVENQQMVVQAVMDRLLSAETLTSPQRVMDVVNGMVPYLTVDEGMDSNTVAGYAMDMRSMRSDDVHMFTMPTGEHVTTSGGAQVLMQDAEAMDLLRRSLDQENMDGFLDRLEQQEEESAVEEDAAETPEDGVEQGPEQDPDEDAPVEEPAPEEPALP